MTSKTLEQQIATALQRAEIAPISIASVECAVNGQVIWQVSSEQDASLLYRVEYRNGHLYCSCLATVVCKHIGKVLLTGATYDTPAEKYGAVKQQLRAGLAQTVCLFERYFNKVLARTVLPAGYKVVRAFDERLMLSVLNVVRPDGIAIMNRDGHARAYASIHSAIIAANRSARMLAIIEQHTAARLASAA